MRKIRLGDSCLNHLTNIPVGFTRKSSYIHTLHSEKSHTKNIMYFADANDATCIATPLHSGCYFYSSAVCFTRKITELMVLVAVRILLRGRWSPGPSIAGSAPAGSALQPGANLMWKFWQPWAQLTLVLRSTVVDVRRPKKIPSWHWHRVGRPAIDR